MERLDKFIASQTGLSRTQAHEKIRAGAVCVNGKVERTKDRKVDPEKDDVTLSGQSVVYRKYIYIMMNKPGGVVSASRDPKERTVIDLVPSDMKRKDLFPAGRLDKDTTGLLIITDDGEFAHRMLAPGKGVYKKYHAVLRSPVGDDEVRRFAEGVEIDGGEVCRQAHLYPDSDGCGAAVEICEGKYHQVKRMFAAVGNEVLSLRRLSVGAVDLDEALKEGECRLLNDDEVAGLLKNKE